MFLLEVTLLPALLLIIMQVMFSGSFEFLRQQPVRDSGRRPAVAHARRSSSAFTMLALSSLSKSSRYVAVLYTGAIFFTEAVYGVLPVITGSTRVAWVSITAQPRRRSPT